MVIVGVCRMVGDDYIRFTLPDRRFNELDQFQMWYSVHLDIRESTLVYLIYTKELVGFVSVISQFLVGRPECAGLSLCAHNAHVNRVSFTAPFPHRRSCAKGLIVRMGYYK